MNVTPADTHEEEPRFARLPLILTLRRFLVIHDELDGTRGLCRHRPVGSDGAG